DDKQNILKKVDGGCWECAEDQNHDPVGALLESKACGGNTTDIVAVASTGSTLEFECTYNRSDFGIVFRLQVYSIPFSIVFDKLILYVFSFFFSGHVLT